MVLTLPARGSFDIIARCYGLGAGTNALLPVKARVGRTCEALARQAKLGVPCRVKVPVG